MIARDYYCAILKIRINSHKMIQRIQSLYLLVSAISMSALFFLPLATSSGTDDSWFSDGRLDAGDMPFMAGAAVCVVISVLAIFLFAQRQRQLLMVRVAMLMMVILTGYAGLSMYQSAAEGISAGYGIVMPVIALLSGWLASKGIQKDEQTVRGMDRLR